MSNAAHQGGDGCWGDKDSPEEEGGDGCWGDEDGPEEEGRMGYSDTSERSRLWPGVKQRETPGCLRGHPERLALSTQPRPQAAVGRGRRPSSGSHLAGAAMQPERDQVDSLHDSTAVLSLQQGQLTRGTSSQGTGAPASRRAS